MSRLLLLAVLMLVAAAPLPAGAARKPSAALTEALEKHDATAIREAVASGLEKLGDRAGRPEVPDEFHPVTRDLKSLTAAEAKDSFHVLVNRLAEPFPWTKEAPPETLTMPLRAAASVLTAAANTLLCAQDHALWHPLSPARDGLDRLNMSDQPPAFNPTLALTRLFPSPAPKPVSYLPAMLRL
jgi:hypothetical protein